MDFQARNLNDWNNSNEFSSFFPGFSENAGIPVIFTGEEHKEIGQEPVIQIFYEGPEKCECCINWVEKRPKEIPEIERQKYEQAAIRLYKRKDHTSSAATSGGLIALRDHSLTIQSQLLVELIKPSLSDIGYMMPEKGGVKYQAPFKELFFAYDALLKAGWRMEEGSTERVHLDLLTTSLEPVFREISSNVIRMRSTKTIDFENLWTLFPKNAIVYNKADRIEQLFQVIDTRILYDHFVRRFEESEHDNKKAKKDESFGRERALQVSFQSISFDGVNFGAVIERRTILRFDGELPIKDLEVYPATFHSDSNIGRRLAARGQNALLFQRNVHCEYLGLTKATLENYNQDEYLNGKVMVDAFGFRKRHPDELEICEPLEHFLSQDRTTYSRTPHWDPNDVTIEDRRTQNKLPWLEGLSDRPPSEHQASNLQFFRRNPQYLMIMQPLIPGFSFKTNRWHLLDVSKASPISWAPKPLDRLVLKHSIKDVVAAFAKHHFENLRGFNHTAVSKGHGIILLLTGPPGTGKTMIAEATAEEAKLPLYRINAGELGSTPTSIEAQLRQILELATEWKAIVLLDEADAFIRVREKMDRTAGEIVSIFLRALEYFKGMLFLTSNLPHRIDPALKSRCRLNIPFENLTPESRREVWRLNFEQRGLLSEVETTSKVKIRLHTEDWDQLVAWNLNGREIHNVVENAILWSTCSNVEIDLAMMEDLIALTVPDASKAHNRGDDSGYGDPSQGDVSKSPVDYVTGEKRSYIEAARFEKGAVAHEDQAREKRRRLSTSA